jgi:hypothetical protein
MLILASYCLVRPVYSYRASRRSPRLRQRYHRQPLLYRPLIRKKDPSKETQVTS